ncbi:lipopolysaccharide transport periplasmic protein LptA [Pantoea sp. Mhis]|uniref:lipopolysaccharide transport periplasmic protein LptA n=1 Tax=Pantoea sp. Mhis TaxID=2576759 RepID=UPI00135802C3|nr:lipopolysaccharide transport periplasmic protein LptA [Pantoea sp. Mhis]MXP56427.1 lipopolysaccharide transport periplasmic protein LptA [Pantoea sp. Mhis]
MKKKIKLNKFRLFIAIILLIINSPILALTGDTDKPINIIALKQLIDLKNNISIFNGKVIVTQGSIKISAQKVVALRLNNQNNKITIHAYGNPVIFSQVENDGKIIIGNTNELSYDSAKNFIELIGNASIQKQNNYIKGDRIKYLIKEKKIQAYSLNQKKRVTTVIIPSQLQKTNHLFLK